VLLLATSLPYFRNQKESDAANAVGIDQREAEIYQQILPPGVHIHGEKQDGRNERKGRIQEHDL
jgi:hypothetical protein